MKASTEPSAVHGDDAGVIDVLADSPVDAAIGPTLNREVNSQTEGQRPDSRQMEVHADWICARMTDSAQTPLPARNASTSS